MTVLAVSILQSQFATLAMWLAAMLVGGVLAWRMNRGGFYKELSDEREAENVKLRADNDRLRHATDITPILNRLDKVADALERSCQASDAVMAKVAEMNGTLKAHSQAMEALAARWTAETRR